MVAECRDLGWCLRPSKISGVRKFLIFFFFFFLVQVKQFGFSDAVGPLSFEEEGDLQVRPYSEALAAIIDAVRCTPM